MNSFDPTSWIQKKRIETRLGTQVETPELKSLLSINLPEITEAVETTFVSTPEPTKPVWAHELELFFQNLVLEQLNQPEELLKLNPSRRESIARFLSEMSQQPEPTDPQETLKKFVRIDRTHQEHEAVKQLFRQIAFVQIGKALLLKSWCNSSAIPLTKKDLNNLTESVARALRPFTHLQSVTFQLIQQNFYSWSKMSEHSREVLWEILSKIDSTADANNEVLDWLLNQAIRLSAETLGERHRYQEELYRHIWKNLQTAAVLDSRFDLHIKNGTPAFAFCPTLRDGSVMKYSPPSLQWIGFEPLTFELIFCEIRGLWKKPRPPFLWLRGSGLEMCMEQQSSLLVTNDGKQNMLQAMDGIASCELAFIAEESLIRTQSRSLAAQALRKQVEQHSILRKLKHPSTTRGMYQACQALDKLRQNGVLIWAREELLSEASGKPALQYILNEAKLMMIADLTALQSEDEDLKYDLPKALYIFKKENQMEVRKNHRPLLVKAYGSLKSKTDIAILFERIFTFLKNPDHVFPAEPFALHSRRSPVIQSEWEQHWLNPSDDHLVERIEDLKRNGLPLGQIAVIRAIPHPATKESIEMRGLFDGVSEASTYGFYAWVENSKIGCELVTSAAGLPPHHLKASTPLFWITPSKPQWNATLQMLLRSRLVQDWLNYSVERKKGIWVLKEHDFKSIPVPKHIHDYLVIPQGSFRMSPAEELLLQQIGLDPNLAHQQLEKQFESNRLLKGAALEKAAEVLIHHEAQNTSLYSLVLAEEQIDWTKMIDSLLGEGETQTLDKHPLIRFSSTLPAHLPIQSVTVVKLPSPGILLGNSKGFTQQLYIQHTWLRELAFERIQGVLKIIAEPTFAELCHLIRLPKNPDQCLTIGQQLLKTFSQEKMRRKELSHLMGACLLSENLSQPQPGLLQ